jgi:hypothetical protein
MGLEPTTFCMASARHVRTRARPFVHTVCFAASSSARANASEPERTPNLAILATGDDDFTSCRNAPRQAPQAATS